MLSIQEFIKKVATGPVVRSSVPMGLGAGLPCLGIAGEQLTVSLFYYRTVLRPDDGTLVMPPEYALSFDYPSGRLVSFETLRLSPRFEGVDFDRPVGTFRHDAIKHLDRAGYGEKKQELFALLDALVAYLGGEGSFSPSDEETLASLYRLLSEPSLHPFYKELSPQFYSRYIEG